MPNPTAQDLERIIRDALHPHFGDDLGDTTFYTPEQWAERGEAYSNHALLNLTFEGPVNHALNAYTPNSTAVVNALNEALERVGCYMELGYAWCAGIYPINP
jgi:hypothetical protein